MMKKHIRRSRHRRRRECANDRVRGNGCLDLFGFKPSVQNRIGRAGENLNGPLSVCAKLAEIPSGFGEPHQIARRHRPWIGRRLGQHRLEKRRHPLQHRFESRQILRVSFRKLRNLLPRHLLVRSHQQKSSVRQRSKTRRTPRDHRETVPLQFQVTNNFRTEQAVHVARRRDFETGPQFLSHNTSTNKFAPFEHQHRLARAGQVSGRYQAVVACSNNDRVVC